VSKLRVFVSSVQKELEHERAALAQLISVDPFLLKHSDPVLYEKDPSTGRPSKKGYLDRLRECQIYLLLLDAEYGRLAGNLSATHEEYRLAQRSKLPTLIFIRGLDQKRDQAREAQTRDFIEEIKRDGHKYVRFHDREDLKPSVRSALYAVLQREFHLEASEVEAEDGEHLIEIASSFEAAPMPDVSPRALDPAALAGFVEAVIEEPGLRIWDDAPEHALVTRGLATPRPGQSAIVSRAAFLLFAPRPAHRFPQCEILTDAYDEPKITGRPKGQLTINAPILTAVEQVLNFIDDHTFHPRRVVGLKNLRLDEYPVRALREALINAVAHRSYDDATRKIILRVFSDRVEVASPGYPPKPLTLAKLRKGNYRPCSRNPLIAQTLALLNQMEQRGTGFARMRDAMLNHGLDAPAFAEQDGCFVVTFPGPNGNYDRIKTPVGAAGTIPPAVESLLNARQRKIIAHVLKTGAVTSGWCRKQFGVTYDTANRDLVSLIKLGILGRKSSGPRTRYELAPRRAENQ
jgi:predicted HTH transcriptional regulator